MVFIRIIFIISIVTGFTACKGKKGSDGGGEAPAVEEQDSSELTPEAEFVAICEDDTNAEYMIANYFRKELSYRSGAEYSCQQTYDYYNSVSAFGQDPKFVTLIGLEELQTVDEEFKAINELFKELGDDGFADLSIMRFFGNLESIGIFTTGAFDWESISYLSNLNYMEVIESGLESIPESWEQLKNLNELSLQSSSLKDISNLSLIPSLVALELISTQVTDFAPIGKNTSLGFLILQENGITAIPETWKDLDLLQSLDIFGETNLTDISNLTDMSSLIQLRMIDTAAADFSSMAGNPSLKALILRNSGITSIPAGLTSLEALDVRDDKLTNIDNITSASELLFLVLSNNTIANVLPIGNLSKLIQLVIGGTGIDGDVNNPGITTIPAEWVNLTSLVDLIIHTEQSLDMTNINIISLPSENLATLQLIDVGLQTLTDISGFTSLFGLNISGNPGIDLGVLPVPVGLEILFVNDANVIAIPAEVANLTSLNTFFAANNALTSVAPLVGINTLDVRKDELGNDLKDELGNVINDRIDFSGNNITECPTVGDADAITHFCSELLGVQ